MKCVVPLAGPDLWSEAYGLRPLFKYDGAPLIVRALTSRSWANELLSSDYIFVIRDIPEAAQLVAFLEQNWPGCGIVKLSTLTSGGMLSALAGVCLVTTDEPIIVDLADILIDDILKPFSFDDKLGIIVPTFLSNDPCYSYIEEEFGKVVGATEKVVTSENASAGIYVFRDRKVFLSSAAHSLINAETLTYNGVFFVCPMVNGVLHSGLSAEAPKVERVIPIGKLFHQM